MPSQKLNLRFHDPNPPGVTADYILKVFVEVSKAKADKAIEAAATRQTSEDKGRPA